MSQGPDYFKTPDYTRPINTGVVSHWSNRFNTCPCGILKLSPVCTYLRVSLVFMLFLSLLTLPKTGLFLFLPCFQMYWGKLLIKPKPCPFAAAKVLLLEPELILFGEESEVVSKQWKQASLVCKLGFINRCTYSTSLKPLLISSYFASNEPDS